MKNKNFKLAVKREIGTVNYLAAMPELRTVRRSERARKGSVNFIAVAWCDLLGVPNEFKLSE